MGKLLGHYFVLISLCFYFQPPTFEECTGLMYGQLAFFCSYPVPTDIPIAVTGVTCDLPASLSPHFYSLKKLFFTEVIVTQDKSNHF